MTREMALQATRSADALVEGAGAAAAAVTRRIETLAARISAWRAYRRTLDELSRLDVHQLADLGLDRGGLRRAAHEAVHRRTR